MGQELFEKLEKAGFTPFGEVDKLTKEDIMKEEIYEHIFSMENDVAREKLIIKLQLKAKELKIARQFDKNLKIHREMFIKSMKSLNKNVTEFTDIPYSALNCGQWVANDTGVYKKDYNNNMQPIVIKASPIPVIPIERLINIDTNTEKVKIAFLKDAKWQEIIVEKNTISSKSKILQLANRGLEVNEDNAKNLITYLADVLELNNIQTKKGVSHLGWVNNTFVPYTDEYCLDVDQEFKQKLQVITEKGSYEEWKKYIKELRSKSIVLKFMMASTFASVLVKLFNLNTFMVHLWGKSGNGKTVAEMICASIWGKPDNSYISNLSNTTIANERLCNFYNNMPIFLDELQIAKTKYSDFSNMVYALTEGKGKERGTVDNGIREQTSWQTIIILTGEEPITTDASKEGVKNRVIEINEDNPIVEDGNAVVSFILENYGFAGKEFIKLIEDREKLTEIQKEFVEELSKKSSYKKQINAFSIIGVADRIVSKEIFKDEPLGIAEIAKYMRQDTDETDRVYNLLLEWFYQNINRFKDNTDIGEIWGKCDIENNAFYVIPKVLKDFLNDQNINFDSVKKKLAEKGYIERSSENKFTVPTRLNGTVCKCVKVCIMLLITDDETPDNLPF